MSSPEYRLAKLLPETTVKEKVKLYLAYKNTVATTEEENVRQSGSLRLEYTRLFDSIQHEDAKCVRRQQKEFKYLTNLIVEAESWLRQELKEANLALGGLALAAEAVAFQARVNFVVRHAVNLLEEGENIFGAIRRPITQEELAKVKAEEEKTILPLEELLDALMEDWCRAQGYASTPYPPMVDLDPFRDEARWKKFCEQWRARGHASFKEQFPSEEEYRRWAVREDYTFGYLVPDATYEAKREELERTLRQLVAEGKLATGTCPQSRGKGVTTKSWFDYLKANGQAKEDYLLGRYLWEDRYYVASAQEAEQWREVMKEQGDMLVRLSSQPRFRDPGSDSKTACLWGARFPEFVGHVVRMLDRQRHQAAIRQAVLERVSVKYFDGLPVPAPYLQRRLEQVRESLKSVAQGLTETLKHPFLEVDESLLPIVKPARAEDVQALLDVLKRQALIWMRWWAGEHAAATFLLESWTAEGLRGIPENPSPSSETEDPS